MLKMIYIYVYIFKIPTLASWHSDGIIFVVGNDKGQFQHFDIALSCIKSQTLTEEAAQANILDLSSYFRYYFNFTFLPRYNSSTCYTYNTIQNIYLHCRIQPALLRMEWNKKTDLNCYINLHNHGNSLLLLIFQRYNVI